MSSFDLVKSETLISILAKNIYINSSVVCAVPDMLNAKINPMIKSIL